MALPAEPLDEKLLRRIVRENPDAVRTLLRSPAWGIAAMLLVLVLAAGNVIQWVRGSWAPKGPGAPGLDAAHQYQLWLVRGQERRSGGVFPVGEDGHGNFLLTIPKDFKGFGAIGISAEPVGGSPAPTGVRVASGKL